VGGLPIWEPAPLWRHQKAIDRIRATIEPAAPGTGCACVHASDVYISFPDGSLKRPDIALFCREPDEQDEAVTLIPQAVIEVVNKGYEAKDLELAPHFYLSQGVADVVVFDPSTLLVLHARRDAVTRQVSPVSLQFQCGCRCTV
jgi:Uma2 family endonuclease